MTGFSPTDYLLLVRLLLAYVLVRFVVPARTLPVDSLIRAGAMAMLAFLFLDGRTLKRAGAAVLLGAGFWLAQRLKVVNVPTARAFFFREGGDRKSVV